MKLAVIIIFTLLSFGLSNSSFSQVNINPQFNLQEKTREVYFFIVDLELASQATIIENHLSTFQGKIVTYSVDVATQMCSLSVKNITDEDLEQVIFQTGFKAIEKDALPPIGYKYIYNPDGTWKLKEI